uniref:Uncharacterized protein n=1 Tax=Cryptosporidium parvum TaxID=5807 RepID=F0X6H4_CRYPV
MLEFCFMNSLTFSICLFHVFITGKCIDDSSIFLYQVFQRYK